MKIQVDKMYRTRGGDSAIVHCFSPTNSTGAEVTFPYKGTIVRKNKKTNWGRQKRDYQIWDAEGKASVFGDDPDDLVEETGDA